jgi:glutamate/aspartate transport system substrate-binding protein
MKKTPALALVLGLILAAPASAQEARLTLDKIKATGTILLGYRETSIPFSFVDKDGKTTGYSVELCQRIAGAIQQRVGVKDLAIRWVPVTPSTRIPELIRGGIDLECGSTTITFSRMEQVDFSFLTFVDGGSLLATADSKITGVGDLGGKRVAVVPGTTTERALAAAMQKNMVSARVVEVADHAEGLATLETGKADAYASDRVLLAGLTLKAKNTDKLVLSGQIYSYEPYALMIRRGDTAFRVEVNRALASLYRSGAIQPIYEKWFGSFDRAGTLVQSVYLLQSLPE